MSVYKDPPVLFQSYALSDFVFSCSILCMVMSPRPINMPQLTVFASSRCLEEKTRLTSQPAFFKVAMPPFYLS